MPIVFRADERSFFLQTPLATYAFAIHPKLGLPVHAFWGRRIEPTSLGPFSAFCGRAFSPHRADLPGRDSMDLLPQECPTPGHGDFRFPSLTIRQHDGSRELELRYSGHRILAGKPQLRGLPATYVEEDAEADTLELDLTDDLTGIVVTLSYSAFRDYDAIARSMHIRNGGRQSVTLSSVCSASVDFPKRTFDVLSLPGAWARERHIARHHLVPGRFTVESRRGTSSHQQHPFLAVLDPGADETTGEVFGFSLVYSGSFQASVEVDQFQRTRVVIGLNPDEFSWRLDPGESFQSPEAVLVFSALGLGGMSQTYHRLYRQRLARGKFRDRDRPCLINNWEATYFDFDQQKLLVLAGEAARLGIELFVLDDGWFGKRDSDNCSLGDWEVDRRKLPDGIQGLARRINDLGLQFGLWFEPEMVSPESELYRRHPDWVLHVENRQRIEGRNQLVLDLSRTDVCDHIIETISDVLRSAPISYVKWDMNRHMTEVASAALPSDRQRETNHRYTLGLYRILEALVSRFPEILFEGCSGGGGRFDPGLLHYMPQSWTSDNTDAISRLKIQYGTSLVYPWSSQAAHISAVPNHQTGRTTSLQTRFHAALTGAFGYELDLGKLTTVELQEIKEQVAVFKASRHLLANGLFYRLVSPFSGERAAWMIASSDQSEAIVIHVKIQVEANEDEECLRLRGLDPRALYILKGESQPIPGDVLMHRGLSVPSDSCHPQSHIWHLQRWSA